MRKMLFFWVILVAPFLVDNRAEAFPTVSGLNCSSDGVEASENATSTIGDICGPTNVFFDDENLEDTENLTLGLIIGLSSLSPLVSINELKGKSTTFSILSYQQISSGLPDSVSLDSVWITIPEECGTYFLTAVLNSTGPKGNQFSHDSTLIRFLCPDVNSKDFDLKLKVLNDYYNSKITIVNGVNVMLEEVHLSITNSGDSKFWPRTTLDAPVLRANIYNHPFAYEFSYYSQNESWQHASEMLMLKYEKTIRSSFTIDKGIFLLGLEMSLVSKELDPGESIPIDLSQANTFGKDKYCRERGKRILVLTLDLLDSDPINNVLILPVYYQCRTYEYEDDNCMLVPDYSSEGNTATILRLESSYSYIFHGDSSGYRKIYTSDLTEEFFLRSMMERENFKRLIYVGLCPQTPLIDDDADTALQNSILDDFSEILSEIMNGVSDLEIGDEEVKEDKSRLTRFLTLARETVEAFIKGSSVFRQFVFETYAVLSKLKKLPSFNLIENKEPEYETTPSHQYWNGYGYEYTYGYGHREERVVQIDSSGNQNEALTKRDSTTIVPTLEKEDFTICYMRCDEGNTCIDSDKVCDGKRDCRDGSDELMCRKKRKTNEDDEDKYEPGYVQEPGYVEDNVLSFLTNLKTIKKLTENMKESFSYDNIAINASPLETRRVKRNASYKERKFTKKRLLENIDEKKLKHFYGLNEHEIQIYKIILEFILSLEHSSTINRLYKFHFVPKKLLQLMFEYSQNGALLDFSFSFMDPWEIFLTNGTMDSSINDELREKFRKIKELAKKAPLPVESVVSAAEDLITLLKTKVADKVREFVSDDETMTASFEFSLQVLSAVEDVIPSATEIASKIMKFQLFEPREFALFRGIPGIEPSSLLACQRALGRRTAAIKAYEEEAGSDNSTQAPFVDFEQYFNLEQKTKPIYWSKHEGKIYKGERSSLLGVMFWENVATCSCYDYCYSRSSTFTGTRSLRDGLRSDNKRRSPNDHPDGEKDSHMPPLSPKGVADPQLLKVLKNPDNLVMEMLKLTGVPPTEANTEAILFALKKV